MIFQNQETTGSFDVTDTTDVLGVELAGVAKNAAVVAASTAASSSWRTRAPAAATAATSCAGLATFRRGPRAISAPSS